MSRGWLHTLTHRYCPATASPKSLAGATKGHRWSWGHCRGCRGCPQAGPALLRARKCLAREGLLTKINKPEQRCFCKKKNKYWMYTHGGVRTRTRSRAEGLKPSALLGSGVAGNGSEQCELILVPWGGDSPVPWHPNTWAPQGSRLGPPGVVGTGTGMGTGAGMGSESPYPGHSSTQEPC